MGSSVALFALVTGLIIVLIGWSNVRYCALSEEEKAEGRKAAAMFFGDDE